MVFQVKNLLTNEEVSVTANNVGHALHIASRIMGWTASQKLTGQFEFKNYEVIPQHDIYTQKVYEPGKKSCQNSY